MNDRGIPEGGSASFTSVPSGAGEPEAMPPISCSWADVFGGTAGSSPYFEIRDWRTPVQVFVGRNGSGKTRTAQALFRRARDSVESFYLSSDRLIGLSTSGHHGGNLMGPSGEFAGVALSPDARRAAKGLSDQWGLAAEALFSLHENPQARVRMAAAIKEAFGRTVDLSSRGGLIDPFVSFESLSYPLLRAEGHGLKELVILLGVTYSPNWTLLVIDEPELNLHPSLTRLWMNLLRDECTASGRKAIVVTHEPRLVDPRSCDDLEGICLFRPLQQPIRVAVAVQPTQRDQVDSDLAYYPQLVADLVFSPHPVLIEGDRDLAAFQSAARRIGTHSQTSQTDFIRCDGSDGVARWLGVTQRLGLKVWAVADLDALFNTAFGRVVGAIETVQASYMDQWQVQRTTDVIRPLYQAMRAMTPPIPAKDDAHREWMRDILASDAATTRAERVRGEKLLSIWRAAGIWLHPQGDLEGALGMNNIDKKPDARVYARRAERATEFDDAVRWALFRLDETATVRAMLEVEIERIAQEIQRAIRINPALVFTGPAGPFPESDSRLVTIQPLMAGRYRIVVKEPSAFRGWTLEFDRSTPPDEMILQNPLQKLDDREAQQVVDRGRGSRRA